MRTSPFRSFPLFMAVLVFITINSAGQTITNPTPGYLRTTPLSLNSTAGPISNSSVISSATVLKFPIGQKTSAAALSVNTNPGNADGGAGAGPQSTARTLQGTSPGGNIFGLTTVPTFQGAFFKGRQFNFTMIGNHPLAGHRTVIPAQITSVSLRLLNANGSVNLDVPNASFEELTLDSPNFEESNYRSGRHIQFGDAVQRAEFFNMMGEDWHTVLSPRLVDRQTTSIPPTVLVDLGGPQPVSVPAYIIVNRGKPNQFIAVLDLLFSDLDFNTTVTEIVAGNYTSDAITMNIYPNTFLFSIDDQGQIAGCCVLGFHSFVFSNEPTTQERWITVFASWTAPGIFGGGAQDITPLSHEISEALNDPFVNNPTPSWQFPGVPATAKICQGNLETGDPIEALPTEVVPITIRDDGRKFTYHPQTEALLQWFEMGTTSNAIDGAFSFPDETALTKSALPCPK